MANRKRDIVRVESSGDVNTGRSSPTSGSTLYGKPKQPENGLFRSFIRWTGRIFALLFALSESNENRYAVENAFVSLAMALHVARSAKMSTEEAFGKYSILGFVFGWGAFIATLLALRKLTGDEIEERTEMFEECYQAYQDIYKEDPSKESPSKEDPKIEKSSRLKFFFLFMQFWDDLKPIEKEAEECHLKGKAKLLYIKHTIEARFAAQRYNFAQEMAARDKQYRLQDSYLLYLNGGKVPENVSQETKASLDEFKHKLNLQSLIITKIAEHQFTNFEGKDNALLQAWFEKYNLFVLIEKDKQKDEYKNKQKDKLIWELIALLQSHKPFQSTEYLKGKRDIINAAWNDMSWARRWWNWGNDKRVYKEAMKAELETFGKKLILKQAPKDVTHDYNEKSKQIENAARDGALFAPFKDNSYCNDRDAVFAKNSEVLAAPPGSSNPRNESAWANLVFSYDMLYAEYALKANFYFKKSNTKETLWLNKDRRWFKEHQIDEGRAGKFDTTLYQFREQLGARLDDLFFETLTSEALSTAKYSKLPPLSFAERFFADSFKNKLATTTLLPTIEAAITKLREDLGQDIYTSEFNQHIEESVIDIVRKKYKLFRSLAKDLRKAKKNDEREVEKQLAAAGIVAAAELQAKKEQLLALRHRTRLAALRKQKTEYQAAKNRAVRIQHPSGRLAYRAAFCAHQKDYYEKQMLSLQPVRGRFAAWCIGCGLGTAISLADGFMGFFNGKNLLLSIPILLTTLFGYFIPHFTVSIAFPGWLLIMAGLCIALSVFLAQMVLARPPTERIAVSINEKAQKGLGRISWRNILKSSLVVPVVFISATGAGLFVAAAVSTLFPPSAIAFAFIIGSFILLEIIAFRGTKLYDEMSFIFRVASGREIIPWHDLTFKQKCNAGLAGVLTIFAAGSSFCASFFGVKGIISLIPALSLVAGPWGVPIALTVALCAFICMAAVSTRPLMKIFVGQVERDLPTEAEQYPSFIDVESGSQLRKVAEECPAPTLDSDQIIEGATKPQRFDLLETLINEHTRYKDKAKAANAECCSCSPFTRSDGYVPVENTALGNEL